MIRQRDISLLGGSFNPIHVGHTMLAQYVAEFVDGVDEVWMMPAACNPLKESGGVSDSDRLGMVRLACDAMPGVEVCDVEMTLPSPSYTASTLRHLRRVCPDCSFSLIIGGDNWAIFEQWKDFEEILNHHRIFVYPRPGYTAGRNRFGMGDVVFLEDVPTIELSSTFLREALKGGHCVNQFLPAGVYEYITDRKLYHI